MGTTPTTTTTFKVETGATRSASDAGTEETKTNLPLTMTTTSKTIQGAILLALANIDFVFLATVQFDGFALAFGLLGLVSTGIGWAYILEASREEAQK